MSILTMKAIKKESEEIPEATAAITDPAVAAEFARLRTDIEALSVAHAEAR